MRTQHSLPGLTIIFLTTLLFVVFYAGGISSAETNAISSRAAVPTIEKSVRDRDEFTSDNEAVPTSSPVCPPVAGSQCVLTSDAVLDRTLVLLSDTTLNCQGHKLRPTLATPVFSPPQVAIFLNHIENVRIKECVIDGFDFGIFAINSKHPIEGAVTIPFKSFEMTSNSINARYTGVSLMGVDDAEVSNNTIIYTRAGGKALYIGHNSQKNRVLNNTFTANLRAGDNPLAFRVPGPKSAANPEVIPNAKTPGAVVVITQIDGAEPTLLNAIIEKQLFQFGVTDSLEPNSDFTAGNRFEGNTIRFSIPPVVGQRSLSTASVGSTLSPVAVDGLALAVAQGTTVRNNRIEGGARVGIRVGMQSGIDRAFPGQCAANLTVRCLDDAGCNIRFDSVSGGPTDVCTPRDVRTVSWISRDTLIEENDIAGPFTNGINTAGQGTTIKGNKINGGTTATGIGIGLVGKHGIETTIVTQNSVSNVAVVLNLIKLFQLEAFSFGSRISLNDFTRYKTAVLTSKVFPPTPEPFNPAAFYNLSSELSVAGQGNFWHVSGKSICRPFDATKVIRGEQTSVNRLVVDIHRVTDSHPFNVSVARTPTGQLPAPCF